MMSKAMLEKLMKSWGAGKAVEDEMSVVLSGDAAATDTAARIWSAFLGALSSEPDLPQELLHLAGMSGRKYRRLINHLIKQTPDASYLEVGSWSGSTACSAMAGNELKITCVDNWSEFGGPYEVFMENVKKYKSPKTALELIQADFRSVDFSELWPRNVYMYDGPHEFKDQYDGICLAIPAFSSEFALIVDDWNYPAVRKGTTTAIKDSGIEIVFSIEIRTTQSGLHAKTAFQDSDWHNGYFIAAGKKNLRPGASDPA